jgi:uncharacterized membrane protein
VGLDAPALEESNSGGECRARRCRIKKYIGPMKKILFTIAGLVSLVLGIALILAWWPDVVSLFKGTIGVVLALAGMILLYMMRI